jgi:hypothetical protein
MNPYQVTMIENFGHHILPLLATPGQQGTLSGKSSLAAAKAVCTAAERIDASLKMAGRVEIATIPPCPDFFGNDSGLAKGRTLAWQTVRNSMRLRWVILTRAPGNIRRALPEDWRNGYKNVCLGMLAGEVGGLPEELRLLRETPSQYRMLFIPEGDTLYDLAGTLEGISWVVCCGRSAGDERARQLKAVCREAGVAFHFHHVGDEESANEIVAEDPAKEAGFPEHPFGLEIQLRRPTLPDFQRKIEVSDPVNAPPTLSSNLSPGDKTGEPEAPPFPAAPSVVTIPAPRASANVPEPSTVTPDTPANSSSAGPDTVVVNCEVVGDDGSDAMVTDMDRNEFEQHDRVVRRELQSFLAVGRALLAIRERELWRAGGHASWADYCLTVGGMTKSHANRLIGAAETVQAIEQVTPIGATLLPAVIPSTEWQLRPLAPLKLPERKAKAWSMGIERSGGNPTATVLSQVVAELMAEEDDPPRPAKPSRQELLAGAVASLRQAVKTKLSPKQIEAAFVELERLLGLS